MRKSTTLIVILGILVSMFLLWKGAAYASCGGSWGPSCDASPYEITGDAIKQGYDATKASVGNQVTDLGISQYAQKIVTYLLTFISLVAVLYIIYAGAQLMIGAGDEEKMKKTRHIILYVIIGILLIWLSLPIVKWAVRLTAYEGGLVPYALAAYTESDNDTFTEYKDKIKEAVSQMESELILNKSVNISTIQNVKSLIQGGFDRLPDNREVGSINREAKQLVDTYLNLAIQNPTSTNHVGNAISRVNNFLDKASISRITGSISAGPSEGNAPLSVSFRAADITDPSGTTPSDNSYVWWTRENGGYRRELSRGPSMSYTFTKEGTYTIFLDVISGSRNSKGKTDVLPLSVSKQISVKPKLGEIILLINGVNVSNMNTLKISPEIGKMGIILDASASRAIGNGTIAETKWEFGNGESSNNIGGPIVERQIYANQGSYILKLAMKTNDGQIFTKDIQLLVRDPSATIKLNQETGHIDEEISMSATSYLADTKNIEYTWQIQDADTSTSKIVKTGEGINFKHKFETVGSYIVSLTAKSPNGNVDTDSKIITIESREPVVTIDNPRPINSERPNTIIFDATKSYDPDSNSRKNLSYSWKIDGSAVILDNVEDDGAKGTYTFDAKGSHKISVTVANVYGKIKTVESNFDVSSVLAVNMIITPKAVKQGTPINIIGQSSNAEFFEWNMGDGSAIISGPSRSLQHIYKQSGIYNVTLTVNRNGGSETNSITRKVYISDSEHPLAIIDASNTSSSIIEEKGACGTNIDALIINRSDSTTFNGSNSINIDGTINGLTYTWKYFGKARTTPSISEKFNELGCFPIELTVRSNKNGASHTTTQYIKLTNRPPELTSVTSTVDSSKKDAQKILVKVQANGAIDPDGVITSYIWYYKTESDPEPQNVQITQKNEITFVLPNITEKYYFGVILEDNDGAKINSIESGQGQSPLVIDNSNGNIYLPLITLTVPKSTVNAGEKVWFSASVKTIVPGVNITNKVEYAWDFDGDGRIDEKSSTPSIEHIYTRSGDYNMKLRVTNNGVSNSKYQTIHVKNKLKASVDGYRLPDGRLYFVNASEGSYDKASWEIGSNKSESLTSMLIEADSTTSGSLTISSNDTDVSSTEIDFSKIEDITGSGLLYQSYPKNINDTITVKNQTDTVIISMLGNDGTAYSIDTDTSIDTDLDGITDNDIDNKDDTSYTDGSIYTFYDLASSNKNERKIRLSTIKNGIATDTKIVNLVLEYMKSAVEKDIDLSSSGVTTLSTGDRTKLEELSKMIRELTDSDRIILMQRYNTLVENWNNPFDKAKSLIDIQEGIDSSSIDTEKKTKISKVIDDLLIGDAQVTDEVGIAAILIRDLIPKESPNHDEILSKLVEIESHPTLLDTNKKLGKEMLLLVEKDTTIPDKYKGHIKNQLLVIINGGSASIPSINPEGNTDTETTATSGILAFIGGFIKVFFIIVGIILLIGVLAFIFYRVTRKGDSIGFQDFLIDSVFHNKRSTPPPVSDTITKSDSVVNGAPPLPKEDPLINYTPPVSIKNDTPKGIDSTIINATIREENLQVDPLKEVAIETPSPLSEKPKEEALAGENIPDWLKVPSSEESTQEKTIPDTIEVVSPIVEEVPEVGNTDLITDHPEGINEIKDTDGAIDSNPAVIAETVDETSTSVSAKNTGTEDDIPEWIKNTSLVSSDPTVEESSSTESPTKTSSEDELPDWLVNSLQSDSPSSVEDTKESEVILPQEIEEAMPPIKKETGKTIAKKPTKKPKPTPVKNEDTAQGNDTANLPSWLK